MSIYSLRYHLNAEYIECFVIYCFDNYKPIFLDHYLSTKCQCAFEFFKCKKNGFAIPCTLHTISQKHILKIVNFFQSFINHTYPIMLGIYRTLAHQ